MKSQELDIFKTELTKNLENSYSAYSNYKVSALLFTENNVFKGVNIEDGVQGICAERSAFVSAISAGDRKFKKMFLTAKEADSDLLDDKVFPCGHCLQFLAEFVEGDFPIYIFGNNEVRIYTLDELMPFRFKR